MTQTRQEKRFQTRFWLLVAAAFAVILWILKPVLLPFVAASVLAYFLDPAVDRLALWRVPRWLGTLFVLFLFASSVFLLFLLVAPLVQGQLVALLHALPGYIQVARDKLMPLFETWAQQLSPGEVEKLRSAAGAYAGDAAAWAGDVLRGIVSKGLALFDVVALLVITPVVAFYLLRDWPKVTKNVETLVPREQHGLFRRAMTDIDRTLSGFLRGQALVCLSLAIVYSVGLSLVGLKYGATIGIIAGFLSFVPYLGSGFVLITSMILAFVQFDSAASIALVFSVFVVGQALEGYVLTPKLVGDRIGLHPVWVLFALFAGGALLGFAGVLIAVPVAAVCGVLIRIGIKAYKESALYHGPAHNKKP